MTNKLSCLWAENFGPAIPKRMLATGSDRQETVYAAAGKERLKSAPGCIDVLDPSCDSAVELRSMCPEL